MGLCAYQEFGQFLSTAVQSYNTGQYMLAQRAIDCARDYAEIEGINTKRIDCLEETLKRAQVQRMCEILRQKFNI